MTDKKLQTIARLRDDIKDTEIKLQNERRPEQVQRYKNTIKLKERELAEIEV